MKKNIFYLISVVIITLIVRNIIVNYCLNNVNIDATAIAEEREYPEYAGNILGFGGVVSNKTIIPIKLKDITPLGSRGMTYVTTLITPWGFSEINQSELENFEDLENKVIPPLKEYEIGIFYKFNGDYVVNPDAYEIRFSILGINFSNVIVTMQVNF